MENEEFPVENVNGINNPDFMKPGEFYVFELEDYGDEPVTMTGLFMGSHGAENNKGHYKFFVYSSPKAKEAEGIFVADTVGAGYIAPVIFTSIRLATPEEIAQLPIEAVEARVKNRRQQRNVMNARIAAQRNMYARVRNVKGGRRRKTARKSRKTRKTRKTGRKTKVRRS